MQDVGDDQYRFVRAIGEVFKAISLDYQRNDKINPVMYMGIAKEGFTEFFNNMKGAISIAEIDVENGIMAEIDRERRFYQEMKGFAEKFKQKGIIFRLEATTSGSSPGMYRDTCWNTGISPQCCIRLGPTKNYIIAFPTGPAIANANQDQHPATILFASPSIIFLLPWEEDLDAVTWKAIKDVLGETRPVDAKDFGITGGKTGNGFVTIDSKKLFSGSELDKLFQEFAAHVLVKTSSKTNNETLYLKTEKELSSGPMKLHYWAFQAFASRIKML